MRDGFIKTAAATPTIKVADCVYNTTQIIEIIEECERQAVKILTLPELCITGYTCGDLFLQNALLHSAITELLRIKEYSKDKDVLIIAGLPFQKNSRLYNVAAVIQGGRILGIVPKTNIPNYSEFYEGRHFVEGGEEVTDIMIGDEQVPFGTSLLFQCAEIPELVTAVEICEDLWVPIPPSSKHAMAGALIIANLSASNEVTGKEAYRRELVKNQSARLVCGYIYAGAGEGESSTDLVFGSHNVIAENGSVLNESNRFRNERIVMEIDLQKLISERRRMRGFPFDRNSNYRVITYHYKFPELSEVEKGQRVLPRTELLRKIDKAPFVPSNKKDRDRRCEEILNIQAYGLKKRLEHTNCKSAVIGISGGLDSTLALLVTAKAFDLLGLNRQDIIAVTMPCFGTTTRTYQNAVTLTQQIGARLREIPINKSVLQHLQDIGHDPDVHDVTYENAQARERTQVLMDVANQVNGMVIGTGDMSELALGWATYNGDHMSMYGVNSSVPKTLVRYLVLYFAETAKSEELRNTLMDILDTPVSPELLPPQDGVISQITEDLVGPYELHDFFLYYILRFGFAPSKVMRLAIKAFGEDYDRDTIYKWLCVFYRRFFSQQFKRSCLPDGPKVGSVAVSPRGDLRMPSDASAAVWMQELESMK